MLAGSCRKNLCHVGGENKKKAEWSFFFLVGPDSSSSEESSTVEYSTCALILVYDLMVSQITSSCKLGITNQTLYIFVACMHSLPVGE